MRIKELKGKYGRPDWNPVVEITFEGTKCMALAIEEAGEKLWFMSSDDFIRSAIRNELDKYRVKHFLEPPEEEQTKEN